MSNPFDQFAVDVQAALPPGAGAPVGDNPFGYVNPPAPAPAPLDMPVMNSGRPGMSMNNGYGQPPQQQQQMYGGMGMGAMGGAPMGQPPAGNPYGAPMMGGPPPMGAPGTPQRPGHQATVPAMNDPFSGFGAPAPGMLAPPTPGQLQSYMGAPPTPGQPLNFMGGPPLGGAPPTPGGVPPPFMAPPGAPPTPGQQQGYMGMGAPPTPGQRQGYMGGPPQGQPYGAPTPAAADPFAAYGAPPPDPFGGALVVSQTQSNPYAQPFPPQQQQQQMSAADPFGAPSPYGAPPPGGDPYGAPSPYGAPPPRQGGPPPGGDPFGAPYPYGAPPPQQGGYGAPPPPQGAPVDPFSVFNSAAAPPPAAPPQNQMVPAPPPQHYQQQAPPPAAPGSDDFFAEMGFEGQPNGQQAQAPAPSAANNARANSGDLPPGGEFYDARIFTPTLGVMFFKPQELTDSLFLNTERSLVDGLGDRPVVAFIVEGSSARSAGVELGHVLLKVNGVDVGNPKDASRLIKEGPRPLPLLFYVPNTDVVVAEGEHMVKYDTRDTNAPNSAKDWKPKYVVIGGIIAQPWMMNMYRSKSEYDIAVIETQARRPVSVKVKQFSLQGARVQNDWQGPQMVKYKNKLHPWKYIVVLPVARNPIKLSSPNLAALKPVHEGIRRVLLAQQRSRGGGGGRGSAAPQRQSRAHQEAYSSQAYGQSQQEQQQGGGGQPEYRY